MYQCRYAFLLTLLLLLVWHLSGVGASAVGLDFVRNEDICGPHNGRRLYLELGEQGVLRADNVSFVKNAPQQDGSGGPRAFTTNSSHDQCSLELVTCPSCVITVTFKSINLQHHCGDGGMTIDSPCRCDYVWISEPPYEDVSGTPFCGHYAPITYRSNTRTLSIALLYSQSHTHAFSIEYTAERNRLIMKGSSATNEMSKSMNNTGGGILTSPFFPSRYPRDLGMEYIITCPTEAPSCRVRVLFSDFQLAAVSIMEFYDWNGQRLDVSSGARFRPPIIVSSGPSLLIRFYANGGTGLGYKAFYSFVLTHLYDKHTHPITDCGGYVENLGGTITMMDMVGEGVKTYDCVWLIRPPKNFLHMKTHMYLKVITFSEMAGNTELIIKQGPTSALLPLEVLRHPVSQLQPPRMREHLAPVTSGFHVSLRGSFGPNSRLAIAYAAFSYMDCYAGSDFLCQNHRCISSQLNCDGFDHCGDNSDEPATCLHAEWEVGLQDRKWQQNKANYYFPKIDRYPDLKTATLVFVASSLGLIVLISALIILLYRVGARARQQRELQSRLRTISELLVLNLADGARIDEISVSDDPPVYEAPPNYDEVIKLGMEEETSGGGGGSGNGGGGVSGGGGGGGSTTGSVTSAASTRRKKRRTPRETRRSRSIPSSQCSCEFEPQMTLNIYEDAQTTNHSSQPNPMPPNSTEHVVKPESPPPPYVTPPGTVPRNFDYSLVMDLPGPSGTSTNVSPAPCQRDSSTESGETFSNSPVITQPQARPRLCRGDCAEAQARRSWRRNSGSFSRSLPTSRAASTSPPRPATAAADGALLGAYSALTCHTTTTTTTVLVPSQASASSSPPSPCPTTTMSHVQQLVRSIDACTSMRPECVGRCASAAGPIVAEVRQVAQQPLQAVPVEEEPRHEEAEEEDEDDPERAERRPIVSCSCEGACGCASSGAVVAVTRDESTTRMGCGATAALIIRRNSIDDSPSTRSRIIRLLAGSRATSRNSAIQVTSLDSANSSLSTNCSTPCGTFGKSCHQKSIVRKLSICSRDSCATKISTISAYNSYEKLHDEFDVVSETTSILGPGTLANTPRTTPRRLISNSTPRSGTRHYSTYDLDSLCESIKALDSFLAQRDTVSADQRTTTMRRNRSMAVMLFGTPRHRATAANCSDDGTRSSGDSVARIRVWKSTDDTFTK